MQLVRDFFCIRRRIAALLVIVAMVVALAGAAPRRIGDNLQIALPVLALGCEVMNGRAVDYLARYAVLLAGIHGSKAGLGALPVNIRPNGHYQGFPSGHTATAAFGAHGVVRACVRGSLLGQATAVLAAGFTGGSRIEAQQHTLWQVLAGAVWGMICDAAIRRRRTRGRLARIGSALQGVLSRASRFRKTRRGAEMPSPLFP